MSEQVTYGLHAVKELLKNRATAINQLLVQAGRKDKRIEEILSLCRKHDVLVSTLSKKELDAKIDGKHQGVVALVQARNEGEDKSMSEQECHEFLRTIDSPFLLILDGVTDPHNLGACLRTADAAGIDAVIIPKDKSASLTPTARKVASGAAESIPLVTVTNLARCVDKLKEIGIWLIGTDDSAQVSVYDQDFTGSIALIMGSEGTGLRRLTREKCDYLVAIPMAGELSSLNVSVATGVALFEAIRQRSS